MKNNFIRLYFLILLTLPSIFCNIYAQNINGSTKEKVLNYFSTQLSNDEDKNLKYSKPIKASQIKEYQKEVWDIWKTSNINHKEEKLIPISPLNSNSKSKWTIPPQLEPNAIMSYYFGSKGDNIPENGYPLYLYTHGSGDRNAEWSTGLKICSAFDDSPSVYFIPQIPNIGEYYRWYQKSKQFAWNKLLRLSFLTGKINPNKVYFFGISEGGYGSQRLASFYADYLAGAGPMAAGEPLINAPVENCANIAFSLRTGEIDYGFDRYKLTQYTKDEFVKIQNKNPDYYKHNIEIIPNAGHSIDYKPTTPWLSQYTRNPYPKFVSWENFEMDGIYRDCFYNLVVKERSNDDHKSRTTYEMRINDNNINLDVNIVTYETTEISERWKFPIKYKKNYVPATKGKVTIYLCEELVDLDKEVCVMVNGKQMFKGVVKPNLKNIVESCATFFDPMRLYPSSIEIDLSKK